jgi:hypothetical protein
MGAERARAVAACLLVLGAAACDPIDRAGSFTYVTDWECPAVDCETLDGTSACASGVCANAANDSDLRVAVRLPTTSNLAPGAIAVAASASTATCPGCVALPTSYTSEHGILVAREAAAQLGWSVGADVVVPATITVEALVDGRTPLGEVLPNALAPMTIDRWSRPLASTPWRSPTGGEPVTARAILFGGTYRRTLDAAPPFDALLPPFADTITVPPGEHMHAVGLASLATVALTRVDLPARAAGWTLYLADATGARRSSILRTSALAGPANFRVDASVSPDPFLLDLLVLPGDESLVAPRLVVPAPTALRRIAYPPQGRSSRVTVRVLDGAGSPVAGARVTLRMRSIEQPAADGDGVFAAYAAASQDVVTGADGTTVVTAPYGNYDAFARSMAGGVLSASAELPFFFARESASITLRTETPRLLEGVCAFVGGKPLALATVEAIAIDDRRSPPSLARSSVRTGTDGSYRIPLPVGAFAFWLHPPPGAPMNDVFLGADAIGGASRTQLPCRLLAPVRRKLQVLDAESPKGAPVSSAIVETMRAPAGQAAVWLGEAVTAPDGRAIAYEAP